MANPFHGVAPEELCDQHLRSAHGEIHMVVASIKAGKSLGDLSRYVDPERLQQRHAELEAYGGWDSPLPEFKPPETEHSVDERFIRTRLAKRCEACADKMYHTSDAENLAHLTSD